MSIWVIGGTSGIGEAVSGRFKKINTGLEVFPTGKEVDVTDYESLESCLDAMTKKVPDYDRLDTVIYCAGINELQFLGEMGAGGCSDQLALFEVNVFGFIQVMDILKRYWDEGRLIQSRGLTVVAISSDAATRPLRTSIGYCASKAGLNMAIKVAARELGPMGWKIFGVSPGMMLRGEMTEYIDRRVPELRGWSEDEALEYEKSQEIVPGRIHPVELSEFICHSVTKLSHLNGSIIEINGGR